MQQEVKRWGAQGGSLHDAPAGAGMTTAPAEPVGTPGAMSPTAAERQLLDTAERALRSPRGKVAVALHLSRLRPPAPRPHHIRIARALLQDTAQRYSGNVFPQRNGDLVLLCTAPPDEGRIVAGQSSPSALPMALARLFGGDAPDDNRLTSAWRLEEDGDRFWAYLTARPSESAPEPTVEETAGTTVGVVALQELVATASVPDLLSQQTAIRLLAGRNMPLTSRLAPLFREITFSAAAIAQRHEAADVLGDPYLFRYFAAQLDARMLEQLHDDLATGGKLTRGALRQNLPLHLNLTLEGIISPAFARLAEMARRTGARFGVEISLMEAAADPPLMQYARRLLDMAGFPLVIDGLDDVGLAMTHPAGLSPSMVKLNWSPRLAEPTGPDRAAIDAALARIGMERIVLQRAETEDALVWGQGRGITRYQGYFLDAVQAASRIASCHSARACTLRQCISRAGALAPSIRLGCGNPGQLDMAPEHRDAEAAPVPVRAVQRAL